MKLTQRIKSAWRGFTGKRSAFNAAAINRLTTDLKTTILSPDAALWTDLKIMRARSRQLERNNDYLRKFLGDAHKNVVGANGVGLQSKVLSTGTTLDKKANDAIEAAWWAWGKKKTCTTTKRQTWQSVKRLVLRSALRDGECLVRFVPDISNPFGMALQLIEADHLDCDYNDPRLGNRNHISMGVEFTPAGEPAFYHLLTRHPGDFYGGGEYRRVPVPASEIVHLFLPDRIGQSRGYPHAASAMLRLNHLAGYEEAELIAARASAGKMGFFEKTTPEGWNGEDDGKGNVIEEAEPGSMVELPMGMSFKPYDPAHPNSIYGEFRKGALRGIASGLGVSYNFLASDLEGVNYSSLRSGALDERETWKALQTWFIDDFVNEVFEKWLFFALLAGRLPYRLSEFDRLNAPEWKPRRWDWVDPEKDMKANILAVRNGFKSRRRIISDCGDDVEVVFQEIAEDEKLAGKYGLDFSADVLPTNEHPPGPDSNATDGAEEDNSPQRSVVNISAHQVSLSQPTKKTVTFTKDAQGRMLGAEVQETPIETELSRSVTLATPARNGNHA